MIKIFLIRHSGPFLQLNYENSITFEQRNNTMILDDIGLEKAKKLLEINQLNAITNIYSTNSTRSIQTLHFLANHNTTTIKIDDLLNERKFGVEFIDELPQDFIIRQFEDKNYKLHNGESLNDVKKRMQEFYKKICHLNDVIIGIHGIALFAFIEMFCETSYDGKTFKIFNSNKLIYDKMIENPDVFELQIDNNKLIKLINHCL